MKSKQCKECGKPIPKSQRYRRTFCSAQCHRNASLERKRLYSCRLRKEHLSERKPLGYPGYLVEWLLDGCLWETRQRWMEQWEGSGKDEGRSEMVEEKEK